MDNNVSFESTRREAYACGDVEEQQLTPLRTL